MTKEECEIETSKAIMEMRTNIAKLEKENAELKAKLDEIRNYLTYDIPHELMNEATNKIWKMI